MSHSPADAAARRAVPPVICYPNDTLPVPDLALYAAARAGATKVSEVLVPPREAACFRAEAGQFFRITSVDGPQVGDLNLWNAADLTDAMRGVQAVYHLGAAFQGGGPFSDDDYFETNVRGAYNSLQAARELEDLRAFVFAGTQSPSPMETMPSSACGGRCWTAPRPPSVCFAGRSGRRTRTWPPGWNAS